MIRKGFILLLLLGGCVGQTMSHAPAGDEALPSPSTATMPSPYGDPDADPDMAPEVPDPEAGIPELPEPVQI